PEVERGLTEHPPLSSGECNSAVQVPYSWPALQMSRPATRRVSAKLPAELIFVEQHDLGESSWSAVADARRAGYQWPDRLAPCMSRNVYAALALVPPWLNRGTPAWHPTPLTLGVMHS